MRIKDYISLLAIHCAGKKLHHALALFTTSRGDLVSGLRYIDLKYGNFILNYAELFLDTITPKMFYYVLLHAKTILFLE